MFSQADANRVVDALLLRDPLPDSVEIVIANPPARSLDRRPPPVHLSPQDLRRVTLVRLGAGEGTITQSSDSSSDYPHADQLMHRLQSDWMTPEERQLKSFTRRTS